MKGELQPDPLKLAEGQQLPPLLVVQGSADDVVAPSNAKEAVKQWASACGAKAEPARESQRGNRYPMKTTDYLAHGRLCARLCQIKKLGHAWSGGDRRYAFTDPDGPDASAMSWRFIAEAMRQRAPVKTSSTALRKAA